MIGPAMAGPTGPVPPALRHFTVADPANDPQSNPQKNPDRHRNTTNVFLGHAQPFHKISTN